MSFNRNEFSFFLSPKNFFIFFSMIHVGYYGGGGGEWSKSLNLVKAYSFGLYPTLKFKE